MAPGRPVISLGIQPQIALYSVILGTVCAFGWYTEKYRRNEGDLDGHIKKLYLQNVQQAQSNMPQMAAAIRGQSMSLDGQMDQLVWGGAAKLKNKNTNANGTNGVLPVAGSDDDEDVDAIGNASVVEDTRTRKRRKRKRKKEKREDEQRQKEEAVVGREQQQKLVLQSSIAGVAVGAVTVAAVSVLFGGVGGIGGRK